MDLKTNTATPKLHLDLHLTFTIEQTFPWLLHLHQNLNVLHETDLHHKNYFFHRALLTQYSKKTRFIQTRHHQYEETITPHKNANKTANQYDDLKIYL